MEFTSESEHGRRSGTLVLHLLGRCNLRCEHCYMDGSPSRREELRLADVLEAVGECERIDIGSLYVTGGEPLLYRGLEEVIEMASAIHGFEVTVCTNGMLVTPKHIELFRRANVRVNISVDGEQEFHDQFRKLSGAFRATERSFRELVAAGIPVTIVMTVSQGNLHSLPAVTQWAAANGAIQLRVQPLLKLGRAFDISDQRLTTDQLNRLLLQLSDFANTYIHRGMKCSLVGVTRRFLMAHPCGAYVCNGAGCHRRVAQEIKKLVVRENGAILPEVTNLSRDFALGRLGDAPLSAMVRRYFDDGYRRFDQFCRAVYAEVLPSWGQAVVPWDQILAERSHTWKPSELVELAAVAGCGGACEH